MDVIQAKSLLLESGEVAIKFEIPVQDIAQRFIYDGESRPLKKYIYIALDNSGSMWGEPFDLAKQTILDLSEEFKDQVDEIRLFIYNHTCNQLSFNLGDDFEIFKDAISDLDTNGGTAFKVAFDKMGENIKTLVSSFPVSVSCILFSDGQDGSEGTSNLLNDPTSSMNQFKDPIKKLPNLAVDFHAVGFEKDHDAILLGKMAEIGNIEGTFQYVENSQDIKDSLEALYHILLTKRLQFFLKTGIEESLQSISLNSNNEALLIMDVKDFEEESLEIAIKKDSNDAGISTLESVSKLALSPIVEGDYKDNTKQNVECDVVEIQIKPLASKVLKSNIDPLTNEELDSISDHMSKLDKALTNIYLECVRLKSKQRKEMIPKVTLIKKLVDGLRENIVLARNKQLSNEKIASWQALASKNAILLGSRAQKAINKRSTINVEAIEKDEALIEKLIQNIDFEKLNSEVDKDLIESTSCPLTRMNFTEAMEESDCIGIGLQVRRSEATVFDPSKLIIQDVCPTFLSCEGFMDILSFEIAENEQTSSEIHGGFSKSQSKPSVTTGLANESINAVMPLFLHKEHWKIASKRSRTILAWMSTLSITGGVGSELKIIPFLVLAKCLELLFKDPNEHRAFIFRLVFNTCLEIYKLPFTQSIGQEVKEKYEQYLASPAHRMTDTISNPSLFLAQLLCAVYLGDIPKETFQANLKFFKNFLVEESFIRKLNTLSQTLNDPEDPLKLLAINENDMINESVNHWKIKFNQVKQVMLEEKSSNIYSNLFQILKETGEEQDKQPSLTKPTKASQSNIDNEYKVINVELPIYTFQPDTFELPKSMKAFIEKPNGFNAVKVLKEKLELPLGEKWLDQWPIEQRFALYHQSYILRKNESKRKALAENTYVDFFSSGSNMELGLGYIKDLYESLVNEKRTRGQIEYLNSIKDDEDLQLAAQFHTTTSLTEAAGILRFGILFRSVLGFHKVITTLQGPLPAVDSDLENIYGLQFAKLKMLVNNDFEGVRLFKDKVPDSINPHTGLNFQIWIPTRRHLYRFWSLFYQYPSKFDVSQFEILFPSKKDYLKLRLQIDGEEKIKKAKA